jgi:hypothetical protein
MTPLEGAYLEDLLAIGSAYVLQFSNITFRNFVARSTGKDIYDDAYAGGGDSKAKRLRTFWDKEPDHVVGKLLSDLLELMVRLNWDKDPTLLDRCQAVADRLRGASKVDGAEVFHEETLDELENSVRQAIQDNQPQKALDHLHTFAMRYVRKLCEENEIEISGGTGRTAKKPLHSLFGEYVKCLEEKGKIDSGMTRRILKTSISTLEAFNDVRNNKSLAHDNDLLNYNESLLIFRHVTATLRFLQALDGKTNPEQP